jgi:hypothetical protein
MAAIEPYGPHFGAVFHLAKARIDVAATRGSQAIGRSSGNPLDSTDYGSVTLTITDDDGYSTTLLLDSEEGMDTVRAMLDNADRVARSRDRSADKGPIR